MDYNGTPVVCEMVSACKSFHVQQYATLEYRVVLVGDGVSDMCTAEKADYVFARAKLQTHCETRGIPFFPFNDFYRVLSWLKAQEKPS